MNINKIIWLGNLFVLSACSGIFLSKLVIVVPELLVPYVIGVGGVVWFFTKQWDEDFRDAIANLLNVNKGEYIVIIFFILLGILVGGLSIWINVIL